MYRITDEHSICETAVWSTFFLLNVSTALKGTLNFIFIREAKLFQRCLSIVDDGQTDHLYTISSTMSQRFGEVNILGSTGKNYCLGQFLNFHKVIEQSQQVINKV